MKSPKEVPPLRVAARFHEMTPGNVRIEWSKMEHHDDHPADDLEEHGSSSGFFHKIKGWIDRQIGAHHDETRMLRRLHKSTHLEITFPEDDPDPELVHQRLKDYWADRQSKHFRRMVLAGTVMLPSLLLTIIPGPNIVGLGLTYIMWHHWRIVQGTRKAASGTINVELKSLKVLNSNADQNEPKDNNGAS